MADKSKIGEAYVSITGDTSGLTKALNDAKSETTKATDQIEDDISSSSEDSGDAIDGLGEKIQSSVDPMNRLLGAVAGFVGVAAAAAAAGKAIGDALVFVAEAADGVGSAQAKINDIYDDFSASDPQATVTALREELDKLTDVLGNASSGNALTANLTALSGAGQTFVALQKEAAAIEEQLAAAAARVRAQKARQVEDAERQLTLENDALRIQLLRETAAGTEVDTVDGILRRRELLAEAAQREGEARIEAIQKEADLSEGLTRNLLLERAAVERELLRLAQDRIEAQSRAEIEALRAAEEAAKKIERDRIAREEEQARKQEEALAQQTRARIEADRKVAEEFAAAQRAAFRQLENLLEQANRGQAKSAELVVQELRSLTRSVRSRSGPVA